MAGPARQTLTLSLLRHGKAVRDAGEGGDIARPLTGRGRRNATAVGAQMAKSGLTPSLILCSSAARTLETLDLVLPQLAAKPTISLLDTLYLAGPLVLLKRLHTVKKKTPHVMIIGHNPGLHALALDLIADGPQDQIGALGRKLPTSGLVVIEFKLAGWDEVVAGTGTLVNFTSPSDDD